MAHDTPELPDIGLPDPATLGAALRAVADGQYQCEVFLAIKEGLLPPADLLQQLLADLPPAARVLLRWLQPACARRVPLPPTWVPGMRWLLQSNRAAADVAYARPDWWEPWCADGWPAARQALGWLLALELPWVEQYLFPAIPRVRANSLLVLAATGEGDAELSSMAAAGYLPAIRALALLPADDEATIILRRLQRSGTRPEQTTARAALTVIARRHGFADAGECERQHLLTAAWDDTVLGDARVLTGWRHGPYRLRVALHAGRAVVECRDALGPLTRIPEALRRSDAYRDARATQRQLTERYRLFKPYLEEAMLYERPLMLGQFRHLYTHPIFAHLAERVLWQLPDGRTVLWSGDDRWETRDGERLALMDAAPMLTLCVVHPVRLAVVDLAGWHAIAAERRLLQPFKQLFREMYTVQPDDDTHCARFAGCRIAPGRAYAVLRAAGFAPGNGTARREWPGEVTAHLTWAAGAEGRDLYGPHRRDVVETGAIHFSRHGTIMPVRMVDPIIVSETLRTADLLTTQAAVGDTEMTARETVALRATLLRQITRGYGITNVVTPEDGRYALVLGTRADYRVNLANGAIMLEPDGRQLVLPATDARWRFTEERDATSDILATILTLAHDAEFSDLTILAQLPPAP